MTARLPTTLRRKLSSYRPGQRGPRAEPITAAQVACAREYRALGLTWDQTSRALGVGRNRLRIACRSRAGSPIAADPSCTTIGV